MSMMEYPDLMDHIEIPIIETEESLFEVIPKLSSFISMAVGDMEYSFEQMRFGARGHRLRQLIHALAQDSHNPFIIVALMILKWNFSNATDDDWGLNESRGSAFERGTSGFVPASDLETTPLLSDLSTPVKRTTPGKRPRERDENGEPYAGPQATEPGRIDISPYSQFFGLNALEIAAIAQAKRFLSQRVVQRVVNDIWNGRIVFWDSLTVHSKKKPQLFNRKTADPYSRLRVPVYRKMFEAAFFLSFLVLYYSVLVERNQTSVGFFEALLDVWIAAFAYDELSGLVDAGVLFYQMDFWSLWNLGIIGVGFAFIIARAIGLVRGDNYILNFSFDILSLEALFLVPRICSLVSLNSYFGSLIPVLKEMTKAFFRFMPVVMVLYIGFLTTFTMLARDRLSLKEMSEMLVKVFFGSGSLGLDSAFEISPIFGYGLMLVFVSMTNILLLSSLISLMSMSLEGVMLHAREEYLFQLSIYVLESSNSRRLTYFMPPLNLIPLLCIRPMRLFLSAEAVRRVRIILLRATHLPFVMLIWMYESSRRHLLSPSTGRLPPASSQEHGTSAVEPGVSRCMDPLHPSVVETYRLGLGNEQLQVDRHDGQELDPARPGQTQAQAQAQTAQITEMISSIERLRVQVERVTANLEAQQGNN
ncbi:hypothetical protein N7481_005052 [Penicillium waksmanii]|uniref:uncharacterized protein n=1 Tax=Penicillium waksmanii TaxID=69791 RepID=UPI002547CE57|nr:uncharacterized protein N7481_005052 [Penicillium waksmanii]KAJ5982953.1 hypothetical protein N7481_005052 [Penicillium waksmanii]